MLTHRQLFFEHVAQTSTDPFAIEIESAEGIYLRGNNGEKYIDLVSGVSVSNVGHAHPEVVKAVQNQAAKHMHLMVYGEMIQSPQVRYAELLTSKLAAQLNTVYYVNSGSEAIEGAMKLAKRATGRSGVVAFRNAYHGGTQGALSILGDEVLKNAFRPLLPGITHLNFNVPEELSKIDKTTACVVVEPVQAEAGIIVPDTSYMQQLRARCDEVGALLIFDEIQTGFGRTGKLFAHEHYDVVPDIMTIAKSMGGGMPIGAFVADKQLMNQLTYNPALGHITTFGGHPVSCAAALASLEIILRDELTQRANEVGNIFRQKMKHPRIKNVRGKGLFLAVDLDDVFIPDFMKYAAENGIIFDPFLFNPEAFRIAPPLIITNEQATEIAEKLLGLIDTFVNKHV
ncbi:MAG TPA: aspartate aminotransferase family protein [Salinivirga sp.]|uniref:aspartate aminotransferase family protein n=1 Tax=Salinivirga sp. TaxID=1970192 RepID=UPI002B491456|nr:aspartate aminotransferase family protein [Salinivirga sp.]HKK59069.1 aspartate aminotransferase family protein [Salinivirga sp.]